MKDAEKTQVHQTLNDFLKGKIPAQEITHAANEICKEPTEAKVEEMQVYLMQFDKEFIPAQTVNTKAIVNNDVRFAMSEIRKIVKKAAEEESKDDDKDKGEGGDPVRPLIKPEGED